MTVRELTRRTAFRIAVMFASLFIVTVAILFAVLYQLITTEIERRLKSHIIEVRDTLIAVGRNEGSVALTKMIADKGPPDEDNEDIFLLTDASGAFLAGNVTGVERFDGWRDLPWSSLRFVGAAARSRATTAVRSVWTPFEKGYLLVGDGNGDMEEARLLLIDGFEWGVLLTLAGSVIGSIWLGVGAQRRISRIEDTLNATAQGNLTARVPISSAHDDLDLVGERINAMLSHLQRAVDALKQVSSDIAHDLKTPIARIQQRVDIALAAQPQSSENGAVLSSIRNDLSNVIETFEAILRIAQIEGGARKARFKDTNLGDVVARVVEAYEAVGEDTNHRISFERPQNSAALLVHGDQDLLTQLFANLIENGIRHTPPGSRIKLMVGRNGNAVTAIVRDDGPGIPEVERENVFRRLYRLDKSRFTQGSGLGLSLVEAIATLHDARITLEDNNPGLAVRLEFNAA